MGGGGWGRRGVPIIAYRGGLHPKGGAPFLGFRGMKGLGFQLLKYMKG